MVCSKASSICLNTDPNLCSKFWCQHVECTRMQKKAVQLLGKKKNLTCSDLVLPLSLCECDQLHPKCINVISCFSEGRTGKHGTFWIKKVYTLTLHSHPRIQILNTMLNYITLSNKLLVQQSEPHFKDLNLMNIPFLDENEKTVWHFGRLQGSDFEGFCFLRSQK